MKDHKEQTISQVEPYKPMEKTEEDEANAPAKKIIEDEVTAADEKLKEETEKAKKELIDQIKGFKQDDDDSIMEAGEEEPEDPRVQKFTVTNP